MEQPLDVSVIIVNWNTSSLLQDCLTSLFEQTRDIVFETIVVDNGSEDDSVAMVRRMFPQVALLENKQNRGFAAANNQGIRLARGRYVLLLNSDTVILDGAIQLTVQAADQYPAAGILGCRVLNRDRTLQPTCFMYPSALNLLLSTTYLYKIFSGSRFFGREKMSWWARDSEREVDVVTGCFMLVRKKLFDEIGLLDEAYFIYGEETDFCYRASQAGYVSLFTPVAEIIHIGGGSSKQMQVEMILQARASILRFIWKHRTRAVYLLSGLLFSLHAAVRIPYWVWRYFRTGGKMEAKIRIKAYVLATILPFFGWQRLRYGDQGRVLL